MGSRARRTNVSARGLGTAAGVDVLVQLTGFQADKRSAALYLEAFEAALARVEDASVLQCTKKALPVLFMGFR